MKKLIFIFFALISISIQAQVANGTETKQNAFRSLSPQTVVSPTGLATMGTDGTIGKSSNIVNQINSSGNSGVLDFDGLSINADPTKYDIGEGIGYIYNSLTGVATKVVWSAQTAQTTPYLTTSVATYVLKDSAGATVLQNSYPTNEQFRTHIYLGKLAHTTFTTIAVVVNDPSRSFSVAGDLHDFVNSIGSINIEGNAITPNGANLQINVSAGRTYREGANFMANRNSPNITNEPAVNATSFRNKFRNGSGGWSAVNTTTVDPNNYDNGSGILQLVPNNKFTIKVVYRFGGSGVIHMDYGQAVYDDMASADAGISSAVASDPDTKGFASRIGWIIIKQGATSLLDATKYKFVAADLFGVRAATSAPVATLQSSYDSSVTPQIVTNTTGGAVAIRRGSASDTDNILMGQNGAGSTIFSVKGSAEVEVRGVTPKFGVFNTLNNYSQYFTANSNGTLFLKNHQDKNLALFINPVGVNDRPQMAIGHTATIPVESQLYVYGGQNGANIDARGDTVQDEANIDLEGNDWETSPNSLGFSYFGGLATAPGTVLGYAKNKLANIRFNATSTALITSSNTTPIKFGINNVEVVNVDSGGLKINNETANTIASFDASKNIKSLSTATYPSLTELSYVKGVTSSVQTQLNGKQATLTNPITGTGTVNFLPKFTGSTTLGDSFIFDDGGKVGIFTNTPLARFHIISPTDTAYPTLGVQKGSFFLGGDDQQYGLMAGINTANGNFWMQAMRNNTATAYNVIMQPVGGKVIIGGTTDSGEMLQVNGSAKISGLAGTGTRTVVADSSGNLSATQILESNTYSPTITNGTNSSVATLQRASYSRNGNIITASISVGLTPTAVGIVRFTATLPVNRTSGSSIGIGGGSFVNTLGSSQGAVACFSNTTSTVEFSFYSTSTNSGQIATATFQYSILE